MADAKHEADSGRLAEFRALVNRADKGDRAVLPVVKEVFDGVPGLWDAYGDLARSAETILIDLLAGNSQLTKVGVRKHLAAMRADLAGPEASPVERLLVDRVVACWLQTQQADVAYAKSLDGAASSEIERCHRRQDRAVRLYLKAIRTLGTVRRLLVTPLQVNIADRQVNIAGSDRLTGTRRRKTGSG